MQQRNDHVENDDAHDQNNYQNVDHLLEKHADLTAKTKSGDTALTFALRECKASVVKTLINHGADTNTVFEDGKTPLMIAAAA